MILSPELIKSPVNTLRTARDMAGFRKSGHILLQAVFLVLLKSVTPLLLIYRGEYPREVLAARGTLEAVC